ncbi:MAG TPA: RHS repeat-associated core domain-containing protein [Pseudomonas sp.]|nr:RHS repeat-associated core domain-containing protein [Pseudomonas sp.]
MPSPTEEVLCTYRYDALDRLTGLKPDKQDDLQRFYCNNRLVTEIQGQEHFSIMQHGEQLLAQQHRVGGSVETDLLVTDQQRSVLQTLGSLPSPRIAYSAYGHRSAASGLTSLLGFNGERRDAITGRYLLGNGYRAFSPVLMRFYSPDKLSPFDKGGINTYCYCSGDPVNRRDPTGKFSFVSTTLQLRQNWLVKKYAGIWRSKIVRNVTPAGTLEYPKKVWKSFSSAQVMPLGPQSANMGGLKGETLFRKSAQNIDGRELITTRKNNRKLGFRIDENYYRNDLMRTHYENQIKGGVLSVELLNMPYGNDFVIHSGLTDEVNLRILSRFVKEDARRGSIELELNFAIMKNAIIRRAQNRR